MISLLWVKTTQIRDTWPIIKEGLKKVESLSKEWQAEDVYMSLMLGQCNLHLCLVDDEYQGFTVTQQQERYGEISLHIWVSYSKGKNFDILTECLDEIKRWAGSVEAKKICFASPRKGWAKQAIKLGFKQSPLITYELEL